MHQLILVTHRPSGSVPKKAEGFVSRNIADGTIIVPVRAGIGDLDAIFTLNGVGAMVWELIDGGTPIDRLASAVSREYEVTAETAETDVREFIELLTVKGLLVAATDEGASP